MFRTSGVIGIVLLAAAGCGSGEGSPHPVTGRVLYKGQPLAGGTIVFAPDPEHGGDGEIAWGEIGSDGRYTLHTTSGEGVNLGWHRVTFAAAAGKSLPPHYSDPARSGKVCEVKPGQTNQIDFELQ